MAEWTREQAVRAFAQIAAMPLPGEVFAYTRFMFDLRIALDWCAANKPVRSVAHEDEEADVRSVKAGVVLRSAWGARNDLTIGTPTTVGRVQRAKTVFARLKKLFLDENFQEEQ